MNKHYACTDFHGIWNLWEQIKNYCDDNDTIYFLGDACDRGPDGLKIIKDLMSDKRVIYIKGNHEDMVVKAGTEILNGFPEDNFNLWIANGGYKTCMDFDEMSEDMQKSLIARLKHLKEFCVYINPKGQRIFLSHAGATPPIEQIEKSNPLLLWDRKHMRDLWPNDKIYKDIYIVHGHTPTVYFATELLNNNFSFKMVPINKEKEVDWKNNTGIISYANTHKIDLDLASYMSDSAVLFDLDELKVEQYFIVQKEKEEDV